MLRALLGLGPSPARWQAVCVPELQQFLSGEARCLAAATLALSPLACLAQGLTPAHGPADVLRRPASGSRSSHSQPLSHQQARAWENVENKAVTQGKDGNTKCVRTFSLPAAQGRPQVLCLTLVPLPFPSSSPRAQPLPTSSPDRLTERSCPPVSAFPTDQDSKRRVSGADSLRAQCMTLGNLSFCVLHISTTKHRTSVKCSTSPDLIRELSQDEYISPLGLSVGGRMGVVVEGSND